MTALPGARHALALRRSFPEHDPDAGPPVGEQLAEHLGTLLPDGVDAPAPWRAYAALAEAELCHSGGDRERARERLATAIERYTALGDAIGAAVCLLTEGDWSAAPYTTPLTWDFALESGSASSELTPWFEGREHGNLDIAAARDAYARAEAAVGTTHAPRARAALRLRHGYLSLREGDAAGARGLALAAHEQFAAAGDARGAWLAAAHAALAGIAAGDLGGDEELVAAIAEWGLGDGGFAHALGLGRLFSRAGRHWEIRAGDAERALAGHRLAESLYVALGAETEALRTLVDRSGVHRRLGDWPTAGRLLDEALQRGMPLARAQPLVPLLMQLYVVTLGQIALQNEAGDPERLEAAKTVFEELVPVLGAAAAVWPDGSKLVAMIEQTAPAALAQLKVTVPLFTALDAELRGHDFSVRSNADAALAAAAGTGLNEAVALDALGRREAARHAYLAHIGESLPGDLADAPRAAADAGAARGLARGRTPPRGARRTRARLGRRDERSVARARHPRPGSREPRRIRAGLRPL